MPKYISIKMIIIFDLLLIFIDLFIDIILIIWFDYYDLLN